jgi:transketolase
MNNQTKIISRRVRLESIRLTTENNASHIGSIFSISDLLAVLFFGKIEQIGKTIINEKCDNFILSKGHAGLGLYIALNLRGILLDEELNSYYKNASKLSGHVSHHGVNGVRFSTGSLGHGLPYAVGVALAKKISSQNDPVVVLVGDGELNEGTTWESALIARQLSLSNLLLVVDYNRMQSLGFTDDTLSLEPIEDKWISFGWNVIRIDGHNHVEILTSLTEFNNSNFKSNRPTVIIADTIKGKGVSFMENNIDFHYRPLRSKEELNQAILELSK